MAETPILQEMHEFYLWPDNVPAWRLFMACATQWRSGMAGREGFDYTGVQIVMREHRIRPRLRRQRFGELQVMEAAALEGWAEAREKTEQ